MNLMSLMATLSLDSSAYKEGLQDSQDTATSAGQKIGKALGAVARAVEVAAAAGAAAVGKLTYDAVKSYANYEQLIGGVETLFQDSADIVSAYADNAYKTAGLSANEYMETVTSFSASLLQSLGGDTAKAAEYADLAITDMSDNANKMGSSMESIQFAYQGFAKQNYTMLDNLKLGYGGTKTEMERLILDAENLDASFQAARDTNGELSMSYADIVDAIHIVQTNMGITGTTAKEAATTIEGSVASMKASWRNLITGLGNADADIGELVDSFTTSLETAFGNIVPVAERAISSMTEALPRLVGTLLPKLVAAINNLLPSLMNTVTDLINSIASQLPTMVSGIVKALPSLIQNIFENIGSIAGTLLPALADSLINVLANLPAMLVGAVGGIVNGIGNLFTGIVDGIKKQAESSIPEDLAKGYVGKIQSNFEKTFSDGWTNMKLTVAKLFGDTDWAESLENLQIISQLEEKIVSDYNTAMDSLSEYSFENFQLNTEADVNTAMTLMGALKGMINPDGTVSADKLGVVESFIEKINGVLGEDAVTLDVTPADWIIKIVEQYQDASGQITDPEALKEEIKQGLNNILGGQEVDLNESTYNAVSKVLSNYSESEARSDLEDIKRQIQNELTAAGIDHVEGFDSVEAFVDSIINEGTITTWFHTPVSSGWSNSAFIAQLQKEGKLPSVNEPAQAEAIAELITKLQMGEIDETQFREELNKFQLTDDEKTQIITYSFNEEAYEDTIEHFKQLQSEIYQTKLLDAFGDASVINTQNYTAAMDAATSSLDKYKKTSDGIDLQGFNDGLNAATEALNSQENEARLTYSSLYDLMGGQNALGESKEMFVERMLHENVAYQTQRSEVGKLRTEEAELASQLLVSAGGYNELDESVRSIVEGILSSVTSFSDFADIMGVSGESADSLQGIFESLKDNGFDPAKDSIMDFALELSETDPAMSGWIEQMQNAGYTTNDLSELLSILFSNQELVNGSAVDLGTAYSQVFGEQMPADLQIAVSAAESAGVEIPQYLYDGILSGQIDTESAVSQLSALITFSDAVEQAKADGTDITEEFVNGLIDGTPDVQDASDKVAEAGKPKTNRKGRPPRDLGKDVSKEFAGGMSDQLFSVTGAAASLASAATNGVAGVPSEMSTTGSDSGSNLDSGFRKWLVSVSNATMLMYGYFSNQLGSGLSSNMYTWAYTAGDKFNSGLALGTNSASRTASSVASSIVSAFGWLGSSLYSAGSDGGSGLYYGFASWADAAVSKAWDTANQMVAAVRRAQQSRSPSRKMMQAGSDAGEGLYVGWTRWEKPILDEAEYIANGMTDVFGDGFGIDGFDSVTDAMNTTATEKINTNQQLLNLLQTYLPQMANMQVVMDGDATVGALMPKIDKSMSRADAMAERGMTAYA